MKVTSASQFTAAASDIGADLPDIKAFAKTLLAANQVRDGIFREVGFADSTWATLLDLFVVQANEGRLSLSDIYNSIDAPKATTLRMIGRLVDRGLLETEADPHDGRRTLVRLTDATYRQMWEAVEEIRGILLCGDSES